VAQVATAWVLRNPVVTAPIVGVTKPRHLADAVAALDLELTDDETVALEHPYTPRTPELLLTGPISACCGEIVVAEVSFVTQSMTGGAHG